MLRVVLPFCKKDEARMSDLIQWMIDLDGHTPHCALLSYEEGSDFSKIESLAARYFAKGVDRNPYPPPRTNEWPEAPNWAWTRAAIKIGEINDGLPWLWMESDVLPLAKDWLDALDREYRKGGMPIMGHVVSKQRGVSQVTGKPILDEHFNGVAVYPCNARDLSVSAMRTRIAPWDVVMSRECLGLCHRVNNLMAHVPRHTGVVLHCNDINVIDAIKARGAVMLHGCNDGSLLQLMRRTEINPPSDDRVVKILKHSDFGGVFNESESLWQQEAIELKKRGHPCISHELVQAQAPSFRDQTEFRTGVIHWLEYGVKCVHLNPGLCVDDDGFAWLLTRRWERWSPVDAADQNWHSTIQAHRVRLTVHSIEKDSEPITLDFGTHPNVEHEDPRVVFHEGKFHVSYCTWERYKRTAHGRQGFSVFGKGWKLLENVIPKYGKNYLNPEKQQEKEGGDPKPVWEKNWTWFMHKNQWKCLYEFSPLTIFTTGRHVSDPAGSEPKIWRYGIVRGGTPPVRHGGLYWTFFHSALPWKQRQRRYYMGAYAFNDQFEIKRITPEPILCGSERDNRILNGPLVIFPCGSLLEEDELEHKHWRVVLGVNDEQCGWISIPHRKLVDRTIEC